jgi:hypothetical protein
MLLCAILPLPLFPHDRLALLVCAVARFLASRQDPGGVAAAGDG